MIRVSAGQWRGRKLKVPSGTGTRPTASRVREAIFSTLGDSLLDAFFIDLFAGSGAMGIDALSRGAAGALFVEIDGRAVATIRENLALLSVSAETGWVYRADARRWLKKPSKMPPREQHSCRILFLDPPYKEDLLAEFLPHVLRLLVSKQLDRVLFEHPADQEFPIAAAKKNLQWNCRIYGSTAITLIERSSG